MKIKNNKKDKAQEYILEAKKILREKAIRDGIIYKHPKYTKKAARLILKSLLLILNKYMKIQNINIKDLRTIDDYVRIIALKNKKIAIKTKSTYQCLTAVIHYGFASHDTTKTSLDSIKEISDWIKKSIIKHIK